MTDRASNPVHVLVLGPDPESHGGIASVIRVLQAHERPRRVCSTVLVTAESGSAARKIRRWSAAYLRFIGLLSRRRIDVVHAHSSVGISFARKVSFLGLARLAGTPTILHVHGSSFDRFLKAGSSLRRALIRGSLRIPSAIVVLSPEWEAVLRPHTQRPIHIVPNGVELLTAASAPAPATIVSLGRLGERKGTFDLIAATSALARSDARLVLAGDGDISGARDAASQAGVSARVETPGWVGREDAAQRLRAATVFALPSYAENLPMALLEAMAAGVPVVATRVGGIPTLIRDGENGLLVDAGDRRQLAGALDRLLTDDALRTRLGDAGRRTVTEQYSAAAASRRLAEIYRDLVMAPSRR
jgi:glycosyltransferase involved in cell wall biosynthesis